MCFVERSSCDFLKEVPKEIGELLAKRISIACPQVHASVILFVPRRDNYFCQSTLVKCWSVIGWHTSPWAHNPADSFAPSTRHNSKKLVLLMCNVFGFWCVCKMFSKSLTHQFCATWNVSHWVLHRRTLEKLRRERQYPPISFFLSRLRGSFFFP